MFVAGIRSVGHTTLCFVPLNSKVNSWFCVNKLLKPIFEKDIPRMFCSRAHLVVLHHDSVPAHKASATVQWLEANNYKFIPAGDWPANSSDLSLMDYAMKRIFKHRLWKKTRNLAGLMRAMKEGWKNISKTLCSEISDRGKAGFIRCLIITATR
jgi:hypothetical protein